MHSELESYARHRFTGDDIGLAPVRSAATKIARSHREWSITVFFIAQLIGLTVLQKIGVPAGGQVVAIALPIMWVGLVALFLRGILAIDVQRLLIFLAFIVVTIVCHMTIADFSMTSMLLVFGIYVPIIFRLDVSRELYLKLMRYFVASALLATPLVAYEWSMQFLVHPGQWLNLELFIPKNFLTTGYSYDRFIEYGSPWRKPNAGIFLEVSILAQYLALAAVVEITYFRRWWVVLVLVLAVLSTLSGTGLVLLVICAPVLVRALPPRYVGVAAVLAIIAVATLPFIGVLGIGDRLMEFQTRDTSGYDRFVGPLLLLGDFLSNPDVWWRGIGAGNTTEARSLLLPFAKLVIEYGLVAAALFYTLMLASLFKKADRLAVPFALLIFYNLLGGGLAVPFYGLTTILLGTLIKVRQPSFATRTVGPEIDHADRKSAGVQPGHGASRLA